MLDFGENLFSAEMVKNPKPAPDVYLYAAKEMDRLPSQTLVIEDTALGAEAALEAGMTVFGYLGSCGDRPPSFDSRVTTFNHMSELPSLIGWLQK